MSHTDTIYRTDQSLTSMMKLEEKELQMNYITKLHYAAERSMFMFLIVTS
jgi:hypothetical protein